MRLRVPTCVLTPGAAPALADGATWYASLFTGAMVYGSWVLVHRLNADPDTTDRLGIGILRQRRADAAS
ncbi:hypothetical protein [Streptomyces sp. NBC_01235]|uniref:hypothetical protein n=1 Tax=Streptomyces sp. NBC_01235 TaxID=2903788 RepID=UPI002E0D3A08|nr:hypothetical protein OG289_16180 [Streptomyces sp. NBC_01235]